jgi:hypothetical protein
MYQSLSEAIDELKQKGYCGVEVTKNGTLKIGKKEYASCDDLDIQESIYFDLGTDPSEEVDLYLLTTADGGKGYLVHGISEHLQPGRADIINRLLRKHSI